MKKIQGSCLNVFLIILVVSTLFVTISSDFDKVISETNGNSIHVEALQDDFDSLNFFDFSEFTNTSHQISVSRVITANQYGYTTSYTKIRLYNNASRTINAFNYTLPSHEYYDTKYLRIYSENGTSADTKILDTIEENNATLLIIKTPTVGENQLLSIIIEMDHPNAISFEESAKLEELTYPYLFNLSFIPLISFPITYYEIEWKIGTDIEVSLNNDSLQPTKDDYKGEFSQDSQNLVFKNVTELTSINRSLLDISENGDYNLTSLANLGFIPAYSPTIASNLTSYLSFEYFQQESTKIEFTKLESQIIVSEWGYVMSEHEIILRNSGMKSGAILDTALGGPTFPIISFYLPEGAEKIRIQDKYGNISLSASLDPIFNKKLLIVRPRVQIEQGAEYTLHLSYLEQISDFTRDLGGGKIQLHIPLTMDFNWTIQQFELSVFLPYGSSYNLNSIVTTTEHNTTLRKTTYNSSIQRRELLGIFDKPGLKMFFSNLTPLSNRFISIDFGLSPLYFITTPLSISILLFTLGVAYIIIRNLSFGFKTKRVILEEIPLNKIREFVKTYEEKTAIREQILKLDRKRKSKNISAREYEQTRKILRNRHQRADRSIVTVSRKLAEEGSRYRIPMRSIEIAEANREDILQNIESLERKKSQGRIGKEAYAKLKLSYDKQLRKANNEIDKVLIDLRSLLTT